MIESNDLRKGNRVQIDNDPYVVVEAEHVKPGKGNAFSRLKLRNLKTGQNLERTFKNGERFAIPDVMFKEMQYLYGDDSFITVMDVENYEQITINKSLVGDAIKFLKENMMVSIIFFEDKPINIELPIFVELAIKYCEPGFKGDTATGASKPATLDGGHVVSVPLHMKEGDVLKIDTRSGEYVEKVNK